MASPTVSLTHYAPNSRADPVATDFSKPQGGVVGLGIELPADVLEATLRVAPMAGLGIFIDNSFFDDVEERVIVESPPMLAPRRSPSRAQAESTSNEFAPMRTPSPSLLASTSNLSLSLPAPSAPSLPCTSSFTGRASFGLGIDIPGLDAIELVSSYRERHPAARVGLGLGLACLNDAELITTVSSQSTSSKGLGVDLSFLEDDDELAALAADPLSMSTSDAQDDVVPNTAYPKPRRVNLGLGFDLNSVDESGESALGSPSPDSPRPSPTLGFDSPFWAMYASAIHDA